MKTIEYKGRHYPAFQAEGNAAQYILPFALKVCKGRGVDIGCAKPEWAFPGALLVDPAINGLHSTGFPMRDLDYVFSSHCLEHVPCWVDSLNYWQEALRAGGTLFLYLPHYSQEYWRPWNNRKHRHFLTPELLSDFLNDKGWRNIFTTGPDLNNSFAVMAEKGPQ